jgi:hypothetical protein
MNDNNQTDVSNVEVNQLGTAKLTEDHVKQAIVEFLYKNDEFKNLVDNRQVMLVTQWQTSKWSNPDAFVHLIIVESPESPESLDEEAPELDEESPELDDISTPV